MAKPKLKEDEKVGNYFVAPTPNVEMLTTGAALLDCVLGGGYPVGRIVNIVGDKSSGKTLLAIEACANFAAQYPTGKIFYNEAEAAFDEGYAATLGMPLDRVQFSEDCLTVEKVFEDLTSRLKSLKKDERALYILDSLDALSDQAELDRDIDEGSFGAAKAKKLSELFRRLVQEVEKKSMLIIIISQVRDNIGVMFGEKHTRSGGRALDFYSSQIIWLSQKGKIEKTIKGVKRVIGVDVKALCKKNKVGMPFRDCEFPLRFAFGIDDVGANIDWLRDVGRLDLIERAPGDSKAETDKIIRDIKAEFDELPQHEYDATRAQLADIVKGLWAEIEKDFLPTRTKYHA